MKVDGGIGDMRGGSGGAGYLSGAAAAAKELEDQGYDGIWTAETSHDPFFPLLLAAQETTRVELGTGIAVAFARNPMNLAQIAWDLQAASGGRFILGLGSQIKPHITKRFSMPWSSPAARMREMILAIRAIWASWNDGTKLDFKGDFYTHTLMTPFFNPGPNPHGNAKITLAGVGELMTEVAGEVCDGFLCHGFTTERYLREVTLPALERGAAKAGRSLADIEISGPAFVVTGGNEEEMERGIAGTKQQIAFYGSTPAYRGVLELHGWGDLQDDLNRMSKEGKWQEMGELITDEILHTFAVVAEPEKLAAGIEERYGDIVQRLSFYAPYRSDPERWRSVMDQLHAV
jgi:probable F420-dependent oxidoreductase